MTGRVEVDGGAFGRGLGFQAFGLPLDVSEPPFDAVVRRAFAVVFRYEAVVGLLGGENGVGVSGMGL